MLGYEVEKHSLFINENPESKRENLQPKTRWNFEPNIELPKSENKAENKAKTKEEIERSMAEENRVS